MNAAGELFGRWRAEEVVERWLVDVLGDEHSDAAVEALWRVTGYTDHEGDLGGRVGDDEAPTVESVRTFADAGVPTTDRGVVVAFGNRVEAHLTIRVPVWVDSGTGPGWSPGVGDDV